MSSREVSIKVKEENLKDVKNVFVGLNRAHYKEISMTELQSIQTGKAWLVKLYSDIESAFKMGKIKKDPVKKIEKKPKKKKGKR